MPDNKLIFEMLEQIDFAMDRIISSFENITLTDDFATSNEGLLRLESACMLISTIGESIKK
ncbi:MAG: hypothetical protein LBR67_06660 [Dysgonamonadaceae bacterium]|jgi:hypothetical protein|nr:hypothetical protein [Dysgonamonadaceae bacterium]